MTVYILFQRKTILGIHVDFIETVFKYHETAERVKQSNEQNGTQWVIKQAQVR